MKDKQKVEEIAKYIEYRTGIDEKRCICLAKSIVYEDYSKNLEHIKKILKG